MSTGSSFLRDTEAST